MTMKASVSATPKAALSSPSRRAVSAAMLLTMALWLLGMPP